MDAGATAEGREKYRSRLVRFVPYGVSGWTGPRRLEFWQRSGFDADRADQLWLAHDDLTARSSLVVGTFDPNERSADSYDRALEVAIKLVNLGLPSPEVSRPEGFGTRLIHYAEQLAAGHEQWSSMSATVNERTSLLRYAQFAGCWAGTVHDYPIGVYGTAERPPTLTLAPVHDTAPYGFHRADGVQFVDMQGPEFWHEREDWHPDHYRLL